MQDKKAPRSRQEKKSTPTTLLENTDVEQPPEEWQEGIYYGFRTKQVIAASLANAPVLG